MRVRVRRWWMNWSALSKLKTKDTPTALRQWANSGFEVLSGVVGDRVTEDITSSIR